MGRPGSLGRLGRGHPGWPPAHVGHGHAPRPEGRSSELQTLREEGRPRPSPLLHPASPRPRLSSALCWDRGHKSTPPSKRPSATQAAPNSSRSKGSVTTGKGNRAGSPRRPADEAGTEWWQRRWPSGARSQAPHSMECRPGAGPSSGLREWHRSHSRVLAPVASAVRLYQLPPGHVAWVPPRALSASMLLWIPKLP